MLVAQTVNSWNKDGLPVDVMFDTNNVFFMLLRISSALGSDSVQCEAASIFHLPSLLLL